jgi:hypothetical protein
MLSISRRHDRRLCWMGNSYTWLHEVDERSGRDRSAGGVACAKAFTPGGKGQANVARDAVVGDDFEG